LTSLGYGPPLERITVDGKQRSRLRNNPAPLPRIASTSRTTGTHSRTTQLA